MLKNIRFWIGVAVTAFFLFLFIYQIRDDFGAMGQALRGADYIFLLPALLIYGVGIWFRAVRWQFLLKPIKAFSSLRLFPLIVVGMMVNNILPARLGIVARAYILGEREGVSKMTTGGTMLVEGVFDGLTLLLFAAVISFFAPLTGWLQQVINITAGIFLGAVVICLVVAASPRIARFGIGLALHLLPARWRARAEEWLLLLVEGLSIMRSPLRLLVLILLSVVVWVCEAGMFFMVGFAFDLGLPFYPYLLGTAVANLAWALLMTQGGLGSFDLALHNTMELFNVGSGVAASYTVVLHAFILLATIPLGLAFLWLQNLSLAKVMLGQRRTVGVSSDHGGSEI